MTDSPDRLETLLNQVMGAAERSEAPPVAPGPDDDPEFQDPAFTNVGQFVDQYLSPVVERRVATGSASGIAWCRRWWAHPEALARIYALWRAWETLRVSDPATGMSVWWRDHFDPHFAVLTSEDGPFARCRPDRHVDATGLPVDPVPPEVLAQLPEAG